MHTRHLQTIFRTVRAALVLTTISGLCNASSGVADCTAIDEEQARLACYDRLHQRGAADEPREASDDFGKEQLPKAREPAHKAADDVLTTVTATGEGPTGRRWFRLETGQLWEQVTSATSTIGAGDHVRITRSKIGTYHLRKSDGSSRSSQVRRLE